MYCPAILSTNLFFSQTERLENEDRQQGQNSPSSRHDRQEHSQIKLLPPAPKPGVTQIFIWCIDTQNEIAFVHNQRRGLHPPIVSAMKQPGLQTALATENKLSSNVSKASSLKRRLSSFKSFKRSQQTSCPNSGVFLSKLENYTALLRDPVVVTTFTTLRKEDPSPVYGSHGTRVHEPFHI